MSEESNAWCVATIKPEAEIAEMILQVFGRLEVPVVSIFPHLVTLEGVEGKHEAYIVDMYQMSQPQREDLIKAVAEKFETTPSEVIRYVDWQGLPILAEHCVGVTLSRGEYYE